MSFSGNTTAFTNCRICIAGKLAEDGRFVVSSDTGKIVDVGSSNAGDAVDAIDLGGAIVAPGFLELQTNGMRGFHFTHFEHAQSYAQKIDDVAGYLPSTGCTGFYATIPTVSSEDFKKVVCFAIVGWQTTE